MMSLDELRETCSQLRAKKRQTDDELVGRIAADVQEYREILRRNATQLPPPPLGELLPLMGWLIYETTWDCVQRIGTSFDPGDADKADHQPTEAELVTLERTETELARINPLVDSARGLPWPEFAPRTLGAFRALALAESKRDTEPGYDAAWLLHEEARDRYQAHRDSHGEDESRKDFVLALDEVFLQLALAETGTACRTAERVIARWSEQFDDPKDPKQSQSEQQRWIQRIFRELTAGVTVGERAIDIGERIKLKPGFADQVDEHRLTRHSALQNPGIMTARAASLLLALRPAMQELGLRPPLTFESWQQWEQEMLQRYARAYRVIEYDVPGTDGAQAQMDAGFQRQLVHVRLNLALLKPGYDLRSAREDLHCLTLNPLDDTAVEAMSEWLAGPQGRGRERALGAATMPMFIRSLIACRDQGPGDDGYQAWRIKWFRLDQHSDEPGRLERVQRALVQATA